MGIQVEDILTRETKPLLKSLTVWGSVATVIVALLAVFGWDVEQATVQQILEAGAIVFGGLVTIIGRVRAKKDISGIKSLLVLVLSAALLVSLLGASAVAGDRQHLEKVYQRQWCLERGGILEYVLPDQARVDCLLPEYAVEFDFASKWAESAGQALYYAGMTQRRAGIVLIMERPERDKVYLERLMRLIREQSLSVAVWTMTPGDIRR